MENKNKKGIVIIYILFQIFGVISENIIAYIYHHFTGEYLLKTLSPVISLLSILFPVLFSTALSLLLTVFLPIKANKRTTILISLPATFVYFIIYVFISFIIPREIFYSEAMVIVFFLYAPLTILVLVLNAAAIWLGTKFHAKRYMT